MYNIEQIWVEFFQWLEIKGRYSFGMNDVITNDNRQIKIEKKLSAKIETHVDDWCKFCNENGYDFELIKLILLNQ